MKSKIKNELTAEEAIKILQQEYLGDSEVMKLAKYTAVQFLEKEIPKPPIVIHYTETYSGTVSDLECPICRGSIHYLNNYCSSCGQRISIKEENGLYTKIL